MDVFLYNSVAGRIELNVPEILLIKEFGALAEHKRNIIPTDKTGQLLTKAFREFQYIYLAIDWTSPYAGYSELERKQGAMDDSGLTETEFNDPLFRAACRKYIELQDSARDVKLVKAAQRKVDELIDYFDNGSDLQERDPISGKPIFKAKDVMAEMSGVGKVLDELEDLEDRLKKKQKAASGLRADKTEGFIPS